MVTAWWFSTTAYLERAAAAAGAGAEAQPKGVELDEPLGVHLVIGALVILEGDDAG